MYNSVAKAILEVNMGPVTFPSEQFIHGHVKCSTVTSGWKLDSKFLWFCLHVLAKLTFSLVPRWSFRWMSVGLGRFSLSLHRKISPCSQDDSLHCLLFYGRQLHSHKYIGPFSRICCKSWCSWILTNLGSRYSSRNPRRNGAAKLP